MTGTDLIELAHFSGERQNDLKDEKLKSQLSSARWILEKSTAMILSASKAYLKHLECECAKENICLVYSFLQEALDIVHYVAVESGTTYKFTAPVFNAMFKTSSIQVSFINAYRQFEVIFFLSWFLIDKDLKLIFYKKVNFFRKSDIKNLLIDHIMFLEKIRVDMIKLPLI